MLAPALPPLVSSPYVEIRETSYGGRGVFATRALPAGTALHVSSTPSASIVYRDFRLEACADCFAYDSGRTWKLSAGGGAARFCSEVCRAAWEARVGALGLEAWERVEGWVRAARAGLEDDEEGIPPDEDSIDRAWAVVVEDTEQGTASARRKEHSAALALLRYHDALGFLLSGIITAYADPALFAATMHLVPTARPYASAYALKAHVASLRTLRALLPAELLPYATVRVARALVARDAKNSFAMWSMPEDDSAEMLGFGIWPHASFFNHSCAPSIAKRRVGREWQFALARDVHEGEELCISYIGESELGTMGAEERRKALKDAWGFDCVCARCIKQSGLDCP